MILVEARKGFPRSGPNAAGRGRFVADVGISRDTASRYMALAGYVESFAAQEDDVRRNDPPVAPTYHAAGIDNRPRKSEAPSYAKQAQDNSLYETAQRIHGRAIKRVGELVAELEARHTGRPEKQQQLGRAPTPITRKALAQSAGLSEHQQKQALRVAAIPSEQFEELIEQSPPPTVTELAERGKKPAKVAAVEAVSDGKYEDS